MGKFKKIYTPSNNPRDARQRKGKKEGGETEGDFFATI
jgi:hypothetical protein